MKKIERNIKNNCKTVKTIIINKIQEYYIEYNRLMGINHKTLKYWEKLLK